MRDTQRSELISTQLRQIAEQAIEHPDRVFTSLIHRLDVDFLREAYHRLRKDGAPGLSGVTVKDYGRELEANLIDLHKRLKEQRYVAPPIKRVWIDKEGGKKKRPIGLSEIEDKLVQKAVSMLMGAVYEQDFHPFSYGFREERNAHQALGEIREQCMKYGIRWIYDADIVGFFDNIDRRWLRTFIQQRINDGGLLRLIGKWLNAGVMEGEQITYSDRGTPQGGTISPCLANVFLHHVLDEWFVNEVKPRMRGHCFIVRFADDFVMGFQREDDARRVMEVVPKRFAKYGLEIHPEKSRLLSFGKPACCKEVSRGDNTFDFLGFTHYWGRSRKGNPIVKRKTARGRFARSLKRVALWCKRNRHKPIADQQRYLSAVLLGHYSYYGLTGNGRALNAFCHQLVRRWNHWLRRRSQLRCLTWAKFARLLKRFPLPPSKIAHSIYLHAANPCA